MNPLTWVVCVFEKGAERRTNAAGQKIISEQRGRRRAGQNSAEF